MQGIWPATSCVAAERASGVVVTVSIELARMVSTEASEHPTEGIHREPGPHELS